MALRELNLHPEHLRSKQYFSGITLNLIRQYVGNDEKKVEYSRRTGFTEGEKILEDAK